MWPLIRYGTVFSTVFSLTIPRYEAQSSPPSATVEPGSSTSVMVRLHIASSAYRQGTFGVIGRAIRHRQYFTGIEHQPAPRYRIPPC
ncbi:hypothetical protein KCP75_25240 [Salmonella enterica subsp. enterica]|nr:hypothetical protein KCP75_25240 [Salmonella enterica subsp. enterica]